MLNSGKENLEMSRYISYDPLFTLEQLLEIKTGFSGGFINTLLPSDSNNDQCKNTDSVFKKKKKKGRSSGHTG